MSRQREIFTADHAEFRHSVARFVASEVSPHLHQWRADGAIPRTLFTAAGAAGFLGTTVPERHGGGGAEDLGFTAVLIEELASAGAVALAWLFAVQAGLATTILTGTDCSHWLPGLVSGELIVALGNGELDVSDQRLSGRLIGVCGARNADLLLVDVGGDGIAVVELAQRSATIVDQGLALVAPEAGFADVMLDGATIAAHLPRGVGPEYDL